MSRRGRIFVLSDHAGYFDIMLDAKSRPHAPFGERFVQATLCPTNVRNSATEAAASRYNCELGGDRGSMGHGIPFVGERGFYPKWAAGSGRWIFQRTLVSVGGLMAGYAELVASRTPGSDQVIVWVPQGGGLIRRIVPGILERERQRALNKLSSFSHRCYGAECSLDIITPQQAQSLLHEFHVDPAQWRLGCPSCSGQVGPNLEVVSAGPILERWDQLYRPPLDNPVASATFKAAPQVSDLERWVSDNDPSHLELAYLGQQLWSDTGEMLQYLASAT